MDRDFLGSVVGCLVEVWFKKDGVYPRIRGKLVSYDSAVIIVDAPRYPKYSLNVDASRTIEWQSAKEFCTMIIPITAISHIFNIFSDQEEILQPEITE